MRTYQALAAIALWVAATEEAQAADGFVSCSSEHAPVASRPGLAMRNLSGGEEADLNRLRWAYADWLKKEPGIPAEITRTGNYPHVILAQLYPKCSWFPDQASVVAQINKELKKLRKKGYAIITTSWTPALPPPQQ